MNPYKEIAFQRILSIIEDLLSNDKINKNKEKVSPNEIPSIED